MLRDYSSMEVEICCCGSSTVWEKPTVFQYGKLNYKGAVHHHRYTSRRTGICREGKVKSMKKIDLQGPRSNSGGKKLAFILLA